ncbi:MAG: mycofactocin precursor peptide peptidase [Actinomycetota bacterium]|nr:mycofactocin precursor peptide peptidase [Actinomycetota bacterium]
MTDLLARIRSPELAGRPTLLIPVGSTEQHGPHLPLGMDTLIAQAVAHGAAEAMTKTGVDVLVAPALAYGSSGEHQHFAGTVSIGSEALRHFLVELVRSAGSWTGRCVFVNGHGGNVSAVVAAVSRLRYERHDVGWAPCVPAATGENALLDSHAGRVETSLALALAPDDVRLERAERGAIEPLAALLPRIRLGGVVSVSANGVLGDPRGASAQEGAKLLQSMVTDVTSSVLAWAPDGQGRLQNIDGSGEQRSDEQPSDGQRSDGERSGKQRSGRQQDLEQQALDPRSDERPSVVT